VSRKYGAIASIIVIGLGTASLLRGWKYANPSYSWAEFDGGSYTASYPSHWKKDVIPQNTETTVILRAAPIQPSEHVGRQGLTIYDLGVRAGTLDEVTAELLKKEIEPSRTQRIRLANGVEAMTWTSSQPLSAEVGAYYRAYAFLGPTKRLYSTTHYLFDWKRDWRSDNLTRRILGSMKFKDPAPAKK
jgi:hypothetical protein